MIRDLLYMIIAYLGGSVLYARIFCTLLKGKNVTQDTPDANPGTANAFRNGGFVCGVLTLCGDLLKGFLPVFLYLRHAPSLALALVVAAPVIGHVFPAFFGFRGGKGIATTFGCLLGLLPHFLPLGMLALFFVLFSVVLRVTPHYYRTLLSYLCTELALILLSESAALVAGFTLICIAVGIRMLTSKEKKESLKVGLLWMR